MVHAVIYGMRGWIAFVAFIEFSNAIRCFFDANNFLEGELFSDGLGKVSSPIARLMGRYSLLNGIIMVHCAICIHHIPIISMAVCSLVLSIILYGSEAFYYYTTPISFFVVFPILVSVFTIICLFVAPIFLDEGTKKKTLVYYEEEEDEDDYETRMIKKKQQQQQQRNPQPQQTSKRKKNI